MSRVSCSLKPFLFLQAELVSRSSGMFVPSDVLGVVAEWPAAAAAWKYLQRLGHTESFSERGGGGGAWCPGGGGEGRGLHTRPKNSIE